MTSDTMTADGRLLERIVLNLTERIRHNGRGVSVMDPSLGNVCILFDSVSP